MFRKRLAVAPKSNKYIVAISDRRNKKAITFQLTGEQLKLLDALYGMGVINKEDYPYTKTCIDLTNE